ncbi:hypothetical protein HN011_008998 [Eciton burchellii]|nr:hypothetical protein HN011_008998 [Eciton burchellii]
MESKQVKTNRNNYTSNGAAQQDMPNILEDHARDNEDEIQSTEDSILPLDNYDEEGKTQDTTKKPGDKNK